MSFVPPPPDPQLSKLAGWLFILMALPIGYFTSASVIDKLVSPSWPRAHAAILSSDMYRRTGRASRWCVKLRYRYVIDNKEYSSDRLAVSRMASAACDRDKGVIEARWEKLQPGARIRIRYDPADPGRSFVYLTDVNFNDYLFLGLAAMLFAGGVKCIKEGDALRAQQRTGRSAAA